ncbi:lysine-specific demethylase JMJ32 [Rutidosis leptorrhynchoides]|uniref:lysine-specific demethylase JMJ32 n=1 Tax=Rutidosis leptorrhynchoides TaxID=125765 RepID=UPI003A9939EE
MNPSNLEHLWEEVRELSFGTTSKIDRLETPPSPLHFLRHYLSQNKPFILSATATRHWPATTLWSSTNYLTTTLSSSLISLHLTPTGHADSLTPNPTNPNSLCFASAHVQPTPFPEAIHAIQNSVKGGVVAYAQQQNDCFRGEYGALSGDVDLDINWASEAIGGGPEAVNLWIGNEASESSFHKDHYENLYVVVCGEKHFVLLPPTDVHRMYIREYPAANYSYSQETGKFDLELEIPPRNVPWCSVNPYPSPENKEKEMSEFPLYYNGPKPFEVTVKAGEMLYLPSMWFHHVRQTPDSRGLTIAVNYWYDMQFDIKYAYFNFLQSLKGFQEQRCHKSDSHASVSYNDSDSLIDENVFDDDENHLEMTLTRKAHLF